MYGVYAIEFVSGFSAAVPGQRGRWTISQIRQMGISQPGQEVSQAPRQPAQMAPAGKDGGGSASEFMGEF